MELVEQAKGQSILQHGVSVFEYFSDLYLHLIAGQPLKFAWKLPDWLSLDLCRRVLPYDVIMTYLTFHDCGKPVCLTIDADGKRHFPDHARVSADVWSSFGGDPLIASLMRDDMVMHLLKAEDVESFSCNPNAPTLLLSALAEIHSNANMFGGLDSTSFKIKWKQINQRGKALMRIWHGI